MSPLPGFSPPRAETGLALGPAQKPAQPKLDEPDVFAEDWWVHARPVVELHGYLRTRAELMYRFSLGRIDAPADAMWPRPADVPYTYDGLAAARPALCTADEAGDGDNDDPDQLQNCTGNTQAGANMRFRLNPEIHVSDNLRIISQIDLLDNYVLGSTSEGYSVTPGLNGGYSMNPRGDYTPLGFLDNTTSTPRSGINSLDDAIHVKRAWGEYTTPLGELRFGRMPRHFGLGMVYHSGDGYDDDYQSTVDRLQVITGIKPLELYFSAAWDFQNEGPTSDALSLPRDPAYDVGQKDDVDQYVFSVARKKSPELQRFALARGDFVINAALEVTYRSQLLAAEAVTAPTQDLPCTSGGAPLGCSANALDNSYTRRDAHAWLPDLWLQILYKKFRFEVEAATIQGKIGNTTTSPVATNRNFRLNQWGIASEIEQLLLEDRLKIGFGFGWATGDADVDGLSPPHTTSETLGQIAGDRDITTFRFNPSYRVDLILFRNILSRVQGAYYFRPSLGYDFIKEPSGQRLGGTIAGIWSRASQFIQAPGHARDLGIELNGALYFQSKDGAQNDDPSKLGGFYARVEYGILFPMGGLGYPSGEAERLREALRLSENPDASSAQIARLYLGVFF